MLFFMIDLHAYNDSVWRAFNCRDVACLYAWRLIELICKGRRPNKLKHLTLT